MANSHYLEKDRLANVVAAIQTLAVSEQTSAPLDRWIAELEASEELTLDQIESMPVKYADRKKWAAVFEQHPEFFKSYTLRGEQRVLLRWRYAQALNAVAKNGASNGAKDGADAAPANGAPDAAPNDQPAGEDEAAVLDSPPLSPDQMQVLINTAIAFYAREAAVDQVPDRLPPLATAAIGAALGTIAGGVVVVLLGWMQMGQAARIFD
jgi:hypothetical protein